MLINISSDHLYIYQDHNKIVIPRGNLEVQLPKTMNELMSKWDFSKKFEIYVINGPWSFTNLRVGCLVCNMIASIYHHTKHIDIWLYDISKLDLFGLLYEKGYLPRYGMIYIWQQKNYWKCDLDMMWWEKVTLADYLHDGTIDLSDIFEGDYFVDEVWDRTFVNEIWFGWDEDNLTILISGKKVEISMKDIPWIQVEKLIPNYILQPNIWSGKL